jgi:mono/diheme cytochrome c family protein
MRSLGPISFAMLLALALPASAQLEGRWPKDPTGAERGKQAFAATCSFCHGSDARGSERAPDLLRSELVNRDEAGELIGQVIQKGRPEKGMPAFPALADQAKDIAAFLHTRITVVMNRMQYPILNLVTGDEAAGKAYFDGAGKCGSCHAPTGDLAGVGARYKPNDLQALMIYPGPSLISYMGYDMRHVARPPVKVTARLKSGQTLTGTAVSVGEYDIALRDDGGGYHSFSRADAESVDVQDPLEAHRRLIDTITDKQMHDLLAYLEGLK